MASEHQPQNKLGQLITQRGYTIQEISTKIGFNHKNSFQEVIQNKKGMPVMKWGKLSDLLGITINELLILRRTYL